MRRHHAVLVVLAVIAALASACGGSLLAGPEIQHATLGGLAFEVPADWRRADSTGARSLTSVWTPEANDRRESVTVIRSDRQLFAATAGSASVEQLLVSAQHSLGSAKLSPVAPVRTAQGLAGARIEVDFKPGGMDRRYRRVHVVLVDGPALIHVLYTAATPDEAADAFQIVLDSIRHAEAQS